MKPLAEVFRGYGFSVVAAVVLLCITPPRLLLAAAAVWGVGTLGLLLSLLLQLAVWKLRETLAVRRIRGYALPAAPRAGV